MFPYAGHSILGILWTVFSFILLFIFPDYRFFYAKLPLENKYREDSNIGKKIVAFKKEFRIDYMFHFNPLSTNCGIVAFPGDRDLVVSLYS